MRTLLLTLTAIVFYFSAHAQTMQADKLIGEWTVKKVHVNADIKLKDEEVTKVEQFTKGFVDATFAFKADKTFDLIISPDAPPVIHQFKIPTGTQWKYTRQKSLITVGTKQDHYNLMSILVESREGKTYFILDESPFLVEVAKK